MALGFAQWHLPPDAFWRLTPREIAGAIAGRTGTNARPLSRDRLTDLLQRYPDDL
ncbi:MAG: phage tail assembly chaperone [Hyphomicrobiales bacterium]|nr:phage tail assembly chaperone [Hyphomicrobiales bacterium]OQW81967.1 MAG: hypothetical protein BVN31_09585 [Proteobacteria bacterium ST_bin15]